MRKTLSLFLALIILVFSVYCTVFADVNKEKDNVEITEVFTYGDRTAAAGVSINIKNLYRENLLWDTTYSIKENTAHSEFSIYKNRIPREYEAYYDLSLGSSFLYSVTGPHSPNRDTGLEKIYDDIIESAQPGVEVKKLFLLSDYMDYYPLTVETSFPGKYISDHLTDDTDAADKEFIKAMREFFRIPIIEGHKIELRVTVNEEGTVYSSGSVSGSGIAENEDDYGFYAQSIITERECFIYFDNKTELGRTADTSLVPGGYGIYRLPYTITNQKTTFDTDSLKNIFPVRGDYQICDLDLSKDGKRLYMITDENGKKIFTVINAESFQTEERTVITRDKDESAYIEYIEEDFIVLNIYHPNRDSKISVYTFDDKGKFKREITVYNFIETEHKDSTRYVGANVYDHNEIKVVWDDGKLYVTNPFDNTTDRPISQNGFRLAVFGKEGLEFYGEYITSLSAGNDGYQASSYHIYNSRYDKIDIILA